MQLQELRAAELERGVVEWYFMTFSDGGERLGSALVEACGPADAALKVSEAGIDPGRGRVVMTTVPESKLPPADKRNRLLTEAEVAEIFPSEGG
jgi:hypothetical protein